MAEISPALEPQQKPKVGKNIVTWAMQDGDTSVAWEAGIMAMKAALQVTGAIGGASIALEGSLDGSNFFPIKDLAGTEIALTQAGLVDFATAAVWIRPVVNGGASTSVTISLVVWQ